MKKANRFGSIRIIIISAILNTLLSWITVCRRIVLVIKGFYDKINTPEKIKEIDYKLSNGSLTKDETLELIKNRAELLGKKLDLEEHKDADKGILEFDDEYRFNRIVPNIDKHIYKISSHVYDRFSAYEDIWEYKFEGFQVSHRIIERKGKGIASNYDEIKDGIILESEIIINHKDNKITTAEMEIERLEKMITRNTIQDHKIRYFLIHQHKKDFDIIEYNQFFRKEIEKTKVGILQFNELNKKFNITRKIVDNFYIPEDENTSEKEGKEYNQLLKELLKKYDLYRPDKNLRSDKVELIEKYLNS